VTIPYDDGRLDAYLAGFVDGEGSFHIAVQKNPSTTLGWQLVPEFHVSQNPERRAVLDLLQERLGCGRIRENHRGSSDRTLILVVRRRSDLLERVVPFFEQQPLLSSKRVDYDAFATVVRAMAAGQHLQPEGFRALYQIAVGMNGGGRYRRLHANVEPLGLPFPATLESLCLRTVEPGKTMKQAGETGPTAGPRDGLSPVPQPGSVAHNAVVRPVGVVPLGTGVRAP
jgi:hypothetical protein